MIKNSYFNPRIGEIRPSNSLLFKNLIFEENNINCLGKNYYFNNLYTDFDNLFDNEISKLPDLLIFYGHDNENVLYKPNKICNKIIDLLGIDSKIEAIDIRYDGNYDLFTNLNLDNYTKYNSLPLPIFLYNNKKITETLDIIYNKRIVNNTLIRITKSHLLLRFFNNEKEIYILDLFADNIEKIYFSTNIKTLDSNFVIDSVDKIKTVLFNLSTNKFIDTNSHIFRFFKKVLINSSYINVIGLLDSYNFEINQKILDFTSYSFNLNKNIVHKQFTQPPPRLDTNLDRDYLWRYKSNVKIVSPKKPLTPNFIPPLKLNHCDPAQMQIIPVLPPVDFLEQPLVIKSNISDEDIKIKLEIYNKIIHQETVRNFVKMKSYDFQDIKKVNNDIKNNLIALCNVILTDLKKL
jgi:hypothetical protein